MTQFTKDLIAQTDAYLESLEKSGSNMPNNPSSAQPEPEQQGIIGDTVDTFERGLGLGIQGLGEAAYQFLPGIGSDIGAAVRDSAGDYADQQLEEMSPRMREAMGKQIFDEDADGNLMLGDGAYDGYTWLGTVSQTIGQYVDVMAGGAGLAKAGLLTTAKIVGKSAAKKAAKSGATKEVAEEIGKKAAKAAVTGRGRTVAQLIGYGGVGSMMSGGMIGEQTREEILNLSDNILDQSEEYQKSYWQLAEQNPDSDVGTLRQQAKELIAEKAAAEVQRDPMLIASNFAMDAIGGKFLDDIFRGVGTGARSTNALKQMGIQGTTESFQGGAEQYASNQAIIENADPTRDPWQDVKSNAATEGVMGGIIGGAGGLARKGQAPTSDDSTSTEGIQTRPLGLQQFADDHPAVDLLAEKEKERQKRAAFEEQHVPTGNLHGEYIPANSGDAEQSQLQTKDAEPDAPLTLPNKRVNLGLQPPTTQFNVTPEGEAYTGSQYQEQTKEKLIDPAKPERKPDGMTEPYTQPKQSRKALNRQEKDAEAQPDQKAPIAKGKRDKAFTPDNQAIDVSYSVIDLADLKVSHDESGKANTDYPAEMQPRDRRNFASQLQIRKLAAGLQPERLAESANVGDGAPIIGPDGVVESGNGRAAAIRLAYRVNGSKAKSYKQFVQQRARELGVPSDQLLKMKQPVLVRTRETEADRADFARRANKPQLSTMNDYEQALSDAQYIDQGMLSAWKPSDSDGALAASNRDFIRAFSKALGDNETAGLITNDGRATARFGQRMQAAIFAKAYDSPKLVEMLTDNTDGFRNIIGGLREAAPDFAAAKTLDADAGSEVVKSISDSVELLDRGRQTGLAVKELLAQQDAFTAELPAETRGLAEFMSVNRLKPKVLSDAMRALGQMVRQEAENSTTANLFGDTEITNRELIDESIRRTEAQADERAYQVPADEGVRASEQQSSSRGSDDTVPGGAEAVAGVSGRNESEGNARVIDQEDLTADAFDLQAQTEQDLQQQADVTAKAEAEQSAAKKAEEERAQADADVDSFNLTGSDSTVDQLEAQGQNNLFDAPAEQNTGDQTPDTSDLKANAGEQSSEQKAGKLSWKKDPNSKKIWRSDDGQIIVNESFTSGGNAVKFYAVYASGKDRDQGNNYAVGSNLAEAKEKAVRAKENKVEEPAADPLYSPYERETSRLQVEQPAKSRLSNEAQFDLFVPSGIPDQSAAQQAKDNFALRYEQAEAGAVRVASDIIKTASDAAHVAAPFRKHAQETMLAIVTDKTGKIVNYIRHTKGAKNSSSVYPVELVSAIAATDGARNVWFAHNHPSGNLKPSDSDFHITDKLKRVMDGTGIDVAGHIVVAPGYSKATLFKPGDRIGTSIRITPGRRTGKVAVTERVLRKRTINKDTPVINSPAAALREVRKISSPDAIMLMTNEHKVIGSMTISADEMKSLRDGGRVNRILKHLDQTNAAAVIIKTSDEAAAKNVIRYFNHLGDIRVLDWFSGSNGDYYSESEKGNVGGEGEVFFRRSSTVKTTDNPSGISVKAAESIAKAFMKAYNGNIDLDVNIGTQGELYGTESYKKNGRIKGAYHPARKAFTLAVDNLSSVRDAIETLRHEVLGHYGLNTFKPADKQRIIDQLIGARNTEGSLGEIWAEIDKLYADDPDSVRAEEVFARVVEKEPAKVGKVKAFTDRLLYNVNTALRRVGIIKKPLKLSDVRRMARYIAEGIREGRLHQQTFPKTDDTQFSKSTPEASDQQAFDNEYPDGMTVEQVQEIADGLNGLSQHLEIVATSDDLPPIIKLTNIIKGIPSWAQQGVYRDGKVYIVASNLQGTQEAIDTIVHEVVGHAGMRALLGDELKPVMLQIFDSFKDTTAMEQVQAKYKHYNPKDRDHQQYLAEELLAHMAEFGEKPGLFKRAITQIRRLLRKAFPNIAWTSNDIYALIDSARRFVERKNSELSKDKETLSSIKEKVFSPDKSEADNYRLELARQMRSLKTLVQPIVIGKTSAVLKAIGAPDFDLVIKRDTVRKATNNVKHSVDMSVIERLPELLSDPVAVMSGSQKDSAIVLVDALDNDGNPVIAAVHFNQKAGRTQVEVNRLASVYGKSNPRALTGNELYYLNRQKNPELVRLMRLQLPASGSPIQGSVKNVIAPDDLVNSSSDGEALSRLFGANPLRADEHFADLDDNAKAALRKIAPETLKQKAGHWLKQTWDRAGLKLRQGMVDRYAALMDLDRQRFGEKAFEENITSSSFVLARMAANASGAVSALMQHGRIHWDSKEKVIDVQSGTEESGGLTKVLYKLGTSVEIERFMGWIAGNRSAKLAEEGRENLFTAEEIEALKSVNTGTTESGKDRAKLYDEVFKEFQQYRDDVLSIAEQAGIITSENRDMWKDEFYVPFYRVADEELKANGPVNSKGLTRQEAYKKLKGGKQNLNDLLENTLMNFHHLIDASLKNIAATQAVDSAVELAGAERTTEVARDKDNSTWIMRDGQKEWYNIADPLLYNSLVSLTAPAMQGPVMKLMRAAKRFFTQATTITPQFQVANLLRDSMQAIATSKMPYNAAKNAAKGMAAYGVWNKTSPTRARMMATGGSMSFGHIYGADAEGVKLAVNNQLKSAKLLKLSNGHQILKGLWDKWMDVNDSFENANRVAIFEHNYKDGQKLKAAWEARDLIDFSAHGAWPTIRFLIDTVPFMNARIQGLDKLYRSGVKPSAKVIREAFGGPGASVSDKAAAKRFNIVTGAIALATISLYLANKDDEEYKKLEEWQKDTYWFIRMGDSAVFIPKPFEVGAIATFAERTLEQIVDDEATGELFAQRMGHMLSDTFSMNPTPQLFNPLLEVYSNHNNFTDRPIESQSQQRLSPEMRKNTNTSLAGEWGGAVLSTITPWDVSPLQADHMIQGYFGQLGAWVAASSSVMRDVAAGKSTPEKAWTEYQPIRRFYRDLSIPGYTKYQTLFYDRLNEVRTVYADIKKYRELGELEKAAAMANQHQSELAQRLTMERISRRLSKLNARARIIRASNMDGELKRRELDRIQTMKNRLTEITMKQIKDAA